MYNFFPIKEVGDSPENDRPPVSPTFHHLNLSGDPLSRQENYQANLIPHYYPPYRTAEYRGMLPPPVGPIYYSLMQPLSLLVGGIYYSPPRPPPDPQHGFLVIPLPHPKHGFAVVPPPTGPGYAGFEDEDQLTDRELWEIYDKIMEARRAKKRQGKRRRERRMKGKETKEMGEVHPP